MKSIIICSDGTWQSPNSDQATHILRIARSIAPHNTTGLEVLLFQSMLFCINSMKFGGEVSHDNDTQDNNPD